MLRNFALLRSLKTVITITAAGLLLLGCTSLKTVSTADNWTTALHDYGRGNNSSEPIGTALVPLWNRDIAPVTVSKGLRRQQLSSPAIFNGLLYIGSTDKRLYAFDLATGKRLWKFFAGSAIESSPTVTDTKVCFGTAAGLFKCLDREKGRELWSFQGKSEITGSALATPELTYIYSSDDRLYALESATGKKVWVYSRLPYFTVTRRIISSPASNADGSIIYQLFSDGTVVALNSKTGKIVWEKVVIKDFSTANTARRTPIVNGNRLYILDADSNLLTLNATDGIELDIKRTDSATDIVVTGTGLLLAAKNELQFLNRAGTEVKWTKSLKTKNFSTLLVANNRLVLLSNYTYKPTGLRFLSRQRGYMEIISLENGNTLWGKRLKGTVTAAASVGHGALALLRDDGLLSLYTSK